MPKVTIYNPRGDLEAVQAVAREVRDVPIAALARAKKLDIDAAVEALKPASIEPPELRRATL